MNTSVFINCFFFQLSFLQNMVGEWALPREMVDNLPPSNNPILGHALHRLIEKSLPPQVEATEPELPSFAVKGCLLGKTLSGKTITLKSLQSGKNSFLFLLLLFPYWIIFALTVAAIFTSIESLQSLC